MKNKIALGLFLSLFTAQTWAGGDNVGNGGDYCENRILNIRNDLHSWIQLGGGFGLKLPQNVSFGQYNHSMLTSMDLAKISCTDQVLKIGQAEKTCVNYPHMAEPQIICNASRFLNATEENQYVLVHHEYAGLSGFEVNHGTESDYQISNQISYFLENQIVKKLAVKPAKPNSSDPFDSATCTGKTIELNDILPILRPDQTVTEIGKFSVLSRGRTCRKLGGCTEWIMGADAKNQHLDSKGHPIEQSGFSKIGLFWDNGTPISEDELTGSINLVNESNHVRFRLIAFNQTVTALESNGLAENGFFSGWNPAGAVLQSPTFRGQAFKVRDIGSASGSHDKYLRWYSQGGDTVSFRDFQMTNSCLWTKWSMSSKSRNPDNYQELEVVIVGKILE